MVLLVTFRGRWVGCQHLHGFELSSTQFQTFKISMLPISTAVEQVTTAIQRHPLLSHVFCYTKSGWPKEVDGVLLSHWNRQNEMLIKTGCLHWCGVYE